MAPRATFAAQAAAVRPRRARRLVGLGALPRLLRGAWLGGSRPQPAQPLLVADRRPDDALVRHLHRGCRRRAPAVRLRMSWSSVTGWAACSRSRPPSGCPISGLVLLSSELPRELRVPARAHELREIPDVYGKALIGWETLPERLLRNDRDLTLADVLRIQHLLGQKPHEAGAARRQMLGGRPGRSPRAVGDATARRRGRPGPGRHAGRIGAPGRVARRGLRALRRPLPLRPGRRREQLPAGRRIRSEGSSRRTGSRAGRERPVV